MVQQKSFSTCSTVTDVLYTDSKSRHLTHRHSTPTSSARPYLRPRPRYAANHTQSVDTPTTEREDDEVAAITAPEGTV